MRRCLLLFVSLSVGACTSSDDFPPTGPSGGGSTVPTLGGTYSSSAMWRFELTSAAQQTAFNCSGSLTIGTQVGLSFTGTFLILDNACGGAFPGAVINGVYRTDGSVTFELTFADGAANFVTQGFGCTYASGDRVMNGTLIAGRLQAVARTELDCVPDGRVSQVMRLDGMR